MIAKIHSKPVDQIRPKSHESFWQGQLGYPQSVVLISFVFALGMALHSTIGYRIPHTLNPVMWLLALLVPAMLIAGRVGRKSHVIHWLTGIPMAVSVTVAVGVLALIGGIVPASVIQSKFHAESIWSSWPFLLMVELMLINLVGSVGKRCWPLNYTNVVYLTTHAGLATAIIGGAGSSLLLERNVMVVFPGEPVRAAMTPSGSMQPLPFSVELREFHLDTFPPVLAVASLDPKAPDGFRLDPGSDFVKPGLHTTLRGYKIEVKKYLQKAVMGGNGWTAAPWKTASPAALLMVTDENGKKHEGWVSSGAIDAPQEHLRISENVAIVMPEPRPKEFRSDLTIHENGNSVKQSVKVNSPIQRGPYTIYQLSYDDKAGAASAYSTLEIVRDPGIQVVYIGMGLMVLGSMLHLFNGVSKS